MTFDLEQLARIQVRDSNKTMGVATNDVLVFDPGGTHNQHSAKLLLDSIVDLQILRSERRDRMTGRWDQYHLKGVVLWM